MPIQEESLRINKLRIAILTIDSLPLPDPSTVSLPCMHPPSWYYTPLCDESVSVGQSHSCSLWYSLLSCTQCLDVCTCTGPWTSLWVAIANCIDYVNMKYIQILLCQPYQNLILVYSYMYRNMQTCCNTGIYSQLVRPGLTLSTM